MRREFRNRIAWFGWGFGAVLVSGVVLMTWTVVTKPPPGAEWALLVVGVFWLFGIVFVGHIIGTATTHVRVLDDRRLEVAQRFPLRHVRHVFAARDWPATRIAKTVDSDGDPYFHCELVTGAPFDGPVSLAEGTDRERIDAVQATFEALRPR